MLGYFIGIIPFFFVSTIYNRNENLSRGFVRKMQNYFYRSKDGELAMTEKNDGYSSATLEGHVCAPGMHR